MKQVLLVLIFFLGTKTLSYTQEIKGLIKNNTGDPVPQAFVYTPSGNIHTHSDINGFFLLTEIKAKDTILISFLGYKTVEKILKPDDFEETMIITLEEKFFELDQINISNSMRATSQVAGIDLETSPVRSSQEILTKVPGLFIAQHAGGGKAEQIFLRGFDIDHGTDIAIGVDGIPVNMVSHAHGQGYADLHFVIPETIEKIDFGKGPYESHKGNFATAGYVDFKTKDKIEHSTFGIELGAFDTKRILSMLDLSGNADNHNFYIASEYLLSNGPFESPQNFNRFNALAKFSTVFKNNNRMGIMLNTFQSKWDASGQIPQRLVDQGVITRFGAVDNTEGGQTARTNLAIDYTSVVNDHSFIQTNAYFSQYNFELFSNFTFFLENPAVGDQIKQFENRKIYGLESTLFNTHYHGNSSREIQLGIGMRYDDVNDNELSFTINRKELNQRLSLGNVDETNMYTFINFDFSKDNWLFNLGSRLDYFNFGYNDALSTTYSNKTQEILKISPKANLIYNPNPKFQVFIKSGLGFHSNDSRVINNNEADEILPTAYGSDLGFVWKPIPRLWINYAFWYLFLDQEFVYVGDAGIVEPSGKSRRNGIEMGIRYQLSDHLFLNSDVSYTVARSVDDPEENNYIPLAPDFLASGNLTYKSPKGFIGSLQYRYIKDRPANEDNSIIAEGYFLLNATLNYTYRNLNFGVRAENLLDTDWNESQFATESRLQNEPQSVEELHFTPGAPLNFRGSIQYNF